MTLERKQKLWHWKGNSNYGIGKEITNYDFEKEITIMTLKRK